MQKSIVLVVILSVFASGSQARTLHNNATLEEVETSTIDTVFKGISKSILSLFQQSDEVEQFRSTLTSEMSNEGMFEVYEDLEKSIDAISSFIQGPSLSNEAKRKTGQVIADDLLEFVVNNANQKYQGPPRPENINNNGTNILDHETPIKQYYGKTFLRENIPYVDIPDANIQNLYYYRWSTLQRHLRYTTAGTGYILTEFVQPVWYAKAFGTIDAAAGHQIDEARWLRSQFYSDDYIQVYTRGPGDSTQYSHWIQDAAYRKSQADGNTQILAYQLNDMIRMWNLWEYTKDQSSGLYYFQPVWDAQERSLPGYVHPDESASDPYYNGPDTYRPSVNAYMVANARAIVNVASQAGKTDIATNFTNIANTLEDAMMTHLWDPVQEFFVDVIRPDNPNLDKIDGREEVGLYPFRFGIGLDKQYAVPSIEQLFDTQGFYAPYGPTTLEIRNQYYTDEVPGCCWWQGQSWPFSTAHVLKSMAAIHRADNTSVTAEQYYDIFSLYTKTQTKDGNPYIAESHFPKKDAWSGDSWNHSEHYDHSTFNDDVITGLLGIVPQSDNSLQINPIVPENWTYYAIENLAYHGHLISYFYDVDGTRYNLGKGLTVFVDGQTVYQNLSPNAVIPIPAAITESEPMSINIAANPSGPGSYPLIEATYTYSLDSPYKANDGVVFYDSIPDNRWTNYQSSSESDTLNVTFARPRNFSSVTLALFYDIDRNGQIDLPSEITISSSSGNIATISGDSLLTNDKNTITFPEVESTFVAVTLSNRDSHYVGICELEVWVNPITGPIYYAVDAQLNGAAVTNDPQSHATSNGAVVSGLSSSSEIAFSGVYAANAGKYELTVSYSNSGDPPVTIGVVVNQINIGSFSLLSTRGTYISHQTMIIDLAGGKHFLSLVGGNEKIKIETIQVLVVLG